MTTRSLSLAAVILILASALWVAYRSDGEQPASPAKLAEHIARSLAQGDAAGWREVFCEASLADLFAAQMVSPRAMDRNAIRTATSRHTPEAATVHVWSAASAGGEPGAETFDWTVRAERHGGHWCVTSISAAAR